MISAVRAARCSANAAMIPCSLFTTARIPTILCADSEGIFLSEYLANAPYVVEGVWQKIEVETMNVVLVNGEKRQ